MFVQSPLAPLRRVRRGDPLYADDWNRVVDRIEMPIVRSQGPTRPWVTIFNDAGDDMPPYSAFTLIDGELNDGGVVELTAGYGSAIEYGGGPIILTNGPDPIANRGYGWGLFVDRWSPQRFVAADDIVMGTICGPTDGFEVSPDGFGLIALTTASMATDPIWCIGAESLLGLVAAKVTTAITARSGTTVGQGVVTLYMIARTTLVSTAEDITIYSCYSVGVAVDTWCTAVKDAKGNFWLVGADCP